MSREVALLKQLDLVLAQQQAAAERHDELAALRTDVERRLDSLRSRGPEEQPPYSFLLLDRLRDELDAEVTRADSVRDAVAAMGDATIRAKDVLQEKESERRRAKEALETVNENFSAREKSDDDEKPHCSATSVRETPGWFERM